jgi:hypothetical protein
MHEPFEQTIPFKRDTACRQEIAFLERRGENNHRYIVFSLFECTLHTPMLVTIFGDTGRRQCGKEGE